MLAIMKGSVELTEGQGSSWPGINGPGAGVGFSLGQVWYEQNHTQSGSTDLPGTYSEGSCDLRGLALVTRPCDFRGLAPVTRPCDFRG